EAADRPVLSHFLIPEVKYPENKQINAPFGMGEVAHTGRIDTKLLIATYKNYLANKKQLIESDFDYDCLEIEENLNYKNITAKNIIFSEGFALKMNPSFNDLPLTGNKGELLTIQASQLNLDKIVKSSVFIIPLGN